MLKKINIFSISAVLFTILYILVGVFDLYNVDIQMDGMLRFLHRYLTLDQIIHIPSLISWIIFGVVYIGPMLIAIILGIKAVIETHKIEKGGEKWFMVFLTLINIFVITLSLLPFIFPSKFLN